MRVGNGRGSIGKTTGWAFPNKIWVNRLCAQVEVNPTKLNRHWGQLRTTDQWGQLWRNLWNGWTSPRWSSFSRESSTIDFLRMVELTSGVLVMALAFGVSIPSSTPNTFPSVAGTARITGRDFSNSKFLSLEPCCLLKLIENALLRQKRNLVWLLCCWRCALLYGMKGTPWI